VLRLLELSIECSVIVCTDILGLWLTKLLHCNCNMIDGVDAYRIEHFIEEKMWFMDLEACLLVGGEFHAFGTFAEHVRWLAVGKSQRDWRLNLNRAWSTQGLTKDSPSQGHRFSAFVKQRHVVTLLYIQPSIPNLTYSILFSHLFSTLVCWNISSLANPHHNTTQYI